MIKFFHVTKTYRTGALPALIDVNLTAEDGEFVYLVGTSGSGKTTILKLIHMEIMPTQGEVIVAGFTTAAMTRRKILTLRRRVGVVFQDYRLLHDRSVYDNVAFPLRLFGEFTEGEIREPRGRSAGPGGAPPQVRRPAPGTFRRGAAADRARPGGREPPLRAPGRRAHRQPRPASTSDEIVEIIRRIHTGGTAVILATHKMELVIDSGERYVRLDERGHRRGLGRSRAGGALNETFGPCAIWLSEGGRGLHRHRGLAFTAVLTMTASLLVLGVFLVTTYNVRRVLRELQDRKEVVVYLRDGVAEQDRDAVRRTSRASPRRGRRPIRVQGARRGRSSPASMKVEGLTDAVGRNPLPDAYHLVLAPDNATPPPSPGSPPRSAPGMKWRRS